MSAGRTDPELQELVMAELRSDPGCANVTGVVIGRAEEPGSESNWRIIGYLFEGNGSVSAECKRAGIAAYVKLSREYHLASDH
jgi:hypothetical protein